MLELITIALFQFFTLNQQPNGSSTVGGTGWGNNDATTVGGTGWGNNDITK